jgi:hypothetical protein
MENPLPRKRKQKTSTCSTETIESLTPDDAFAGHKRQYEFHAAAWRVARTRGDEKLSRKSAKQMLLHLQEMYRLATHSRS